MSLVERYLNQMEWDEPLCNPEVHSVVGGIRKFFKATTLKINANGTVQSEQQVLAHSSTHSRVSIF